MAIWNENLNMNRVTAVKGLALETLDSVPPITFIFVSFRIIYKRQSSFSVVDMYIQYFNILIYSQDIINSGTVTTATS